MEPIKQRRPTKPKESRAIMNAVGPANESGVFETDGEYIYVNALAHGTGRYTRYKLDKGAAKNLMWSLERVLGDMA